jgi:hypothetical protein
LIVKELPDIDRRLIKRLMKERSLLVGEERYNRGWSRLGWGLFKNAYREDPGSRRL